MTTGKDLPPLPEPVAQRINTLEGMGCAPKWLYEHGSRASAFTAHQLYTADQMHAYLLADRAQRVEQAEPVADLYFIQDTRSFVGNCPMWWGPDGRGYTTRIDEAGRYTKDSAMAKHRHRPTDKPWRCADILPLARPTIDMQDLPRAAAPSTKEGDHV